MNTIDDMQNEKYFYGYYTMFDYNLYFFEIFMKTRRQQ